jgi:conjugal transfer/type IV secretion protein DotA/TraY
MNLKILFTVALFLFTSLSFAQSGSLPGLTASTTDVSVNRLLADLFGGLIPSEYMAGGAGLNPLASVIGQFNAIVLIFGGVLMAYTLVASTMQTAHDGEILGKRWSSMWLPLRTGLGVAAIVPLPGGPGYAVCQYIVMWLVVQGVGAANLLWTTFATNIQPTAQMALIHNYGPVNDLAANTLRHSMCITVVNAEIEKAKEAAKAEGYTYNGFEPISSLEDGTAPQNKGRGGAALVKRQQDAMARACGVYKNPSSDIPEQANTQLSQLFGGDQKVKNFASAMYVTQSGSFDMLRQGMMRLAQDIYKNKESADGGQGLDEEAASLRYTELVNEYNARIAETVKSGSSGISESNEVAQNATRDGWALAGAFYLKYIKIQQALSDIIQRFPSMSAPSIGAIGKMFQEQVNAYGNQVEGILKSSKYKDELGVQRQAASDETALVDKDAKLFSKKIAETAVKAGLKEPKVLFNVDSSKNVLLSMTDAGYKLVASTVWASAIFAAVSTVLPDSTVIASMPFILALFGALIGSAVVLAFIIPMTPFIIWIGVVLGWLVMVVEAIIAAPLWILAHLHPDGDGIVGQAGQGYSLIFALFMRPPLAILGLLASMAIMNPIGALFIDAYWSVIAISIDKSGWGLTALTAYAASLVLFASALLGIVNKVFALIHIIPDQILKWMGGPSGNLGEYGGDLARGSVGAGAAVGAAAGSLGGKAIEGANSFKQLQAQKAGNRRQAEGNMADERARMIEQKQGDQERIGKTEQAYAARGLSEGRGVGKANNAANTAYANEMGRAISQLQGTKAYKEADDAGKSEQIEAQMLANVNQGKQPSDASANLDQWQDSQREAAYSEWRNDTNNQLPAGTAATYASAVDKFSASAPPSVKEKPAPGNNNGAG